MKKYLFTIVFLIAWTLFIIIGADNPVEWDVVFVSFCIGLLMVIPVGLLVDYYKNNKSL